MKVIWETLYYEDHGATLKHKCGKRIVTLSLLSFFLIIYFFYLGLILFFMASFFSPLFRPESHLDLWGNHSLYHPFLTWDNVLIMMIITLLFYLQLKNYNSILRTKYDSMWMPPMADLLRKERILRTTRRTQGQSRGETRDNHSNQQEQSHMC